MTSDALRHLRRTKRTACQTNRVQVKESEASGVARTLEQWADLLTGGNTSDPLEAFEQWEQEQQALAELFDENQAYNILNRRLWLALDVAFTVLALTEKDAGMFITEKTRKRIAEFRDQYNKLTDNKALSSELNERKSDHVEISRNPQRHVRRSKD